MHTLHFCTLPTVQECKECTGVIPEFEMMTTEFFLGVPLYPLQWFTAQRPISGEQSHPCCRARKLQPCGKFLSILGNFSSRIVFDNAKNIPNMPKRSTPLGTPERLNKKPYTPIAPQLKLVRI